jgi:hypothetical protein
MGKSEPSRPAGSRQPAGNRSLGEGCEMNQKHLLKTLLILSLSTAFLLNLSGNGVCIDKTKIDLSEYRGGNTNRTFIAYKYSFGVRIAGTLQLVYTDMENGFHLQWYENYDDGTAQHLEFDYEVTGKGLYEMNTYRYVGGEEYKYTYRDPPNGIPPTPGPGPPKPLLSFPYSVVEVGYMWGDAFIEKLDHQTYNNFSRVYQFAIVGLEDVTVPAGTFQGCVKIARFRGNQADRIAWYAKGIGLVKLIYAQEEHSHATPDGVVYQFAGYNRAYVLESHE